MIENLSNSKDKMPPWAQSLRLAYSKYKNLEQEFQKLLGSPGSFDGSVDRALRYEGETILQDKISALQRGTEALPETIALHATFSSAPREDFAAGLATHGASRTIEVGLGKADYFLPATYGRYTVRNPESNPQLLPESKDFIGFEAIRTGLAQKRLHDAHLSDARPKSRELMLNKGADASIKPSELELIIQTLEEKMVSEESKRVIAELTTALDSAEKNYAAQREAIEHQYAPQVLSRIGNISKALVGNRVVRLPKTIEWENYWGKDPDGSTEDTYLIYIPAENKLCIAPLRPQKKFLRVAVKVPDMRLARNSSDTILMQNASNIVLRLRDYLRP